MPSIVLRAPGDFESAFDDIRAELDVPRGFPDEVLDEADAARPDPNVERVDARHLGLLAIDPPGSTDLDQAFAAERREHGFRVHYAIADVGAFVAPGGAVDLEARRRGATLYSPDQRAPLHPPVLSEDRVSLLPGQDKPSLLWTIDLDASARPTNWHLERATVRVDEAISYREAQRRIDGAIGSKDSSLELLAVIGRLRQEREADRGGVSLNLPAQEIVKNDGGYSLEFDQPLAVEGWNAQISLLTGMVAGQTMMDAGIGILRTLPPAEQNDINTLRRTAAALGLDWPSHIGYATFVRSLRPTTAAHNAFLVQCTRLFKGAGYYGFAGRHPDDVEHSAIAALYSHVTAPLRRLVDRFGNEILLALLSGAEPPGWAVEALGELPSLMGRARQRESALERAMLDMTEVLVLEHHVGEEFDSVVVDVATSDGGQATVQIPDPAIVTRLPAGELSLADQVQLRLLGVDRDSRSLNFEPVERTRPAP